MFIRDGTPSGFSTMSIGCRLPCAACPRPDDLGDHALVTVTAGHLVAGLQATLDGHVDLTIFWTPGAVRRPG